MNFSNPDFIKRWEGYSEIAYKDGGGVWTIGYGHTANVKPGQKITKEEALDLMRQDLQWAVDTVIKGIKRPITQNQFDAFVSLCYNIGPSGFTGSTALRKFNAGDIQGAAEAITWWNKDNGKVVQGLVNRRAAERDLFLSPDTIQPVVINTRQQAIDALFEEFKKRLMEII